MCKEALDDGRAQKSRGTGDEDHYATREGSSRRWANTASVMAATFSMSR